MKTPLPRAVLLAAMLGLATLSVTACSPRIDSRGNSIDPKVLAEIKPGEYTREMVMEKLGSPSTQSTFDSNEWYYMSETTETTAFFKPELVTRQIVIIKFDKHGVVSSIDEMGKDQAENVEPVDRTTPTAGNSLGLVEQLLSNIGRFNKDKGAK